MFFLAHVIHLKKSSIILKLKTDEQITFITAPKYFGDGYVMPMVAISIGEENLLEFEDGYENLLAWLEDTYKEG